MFTAPSVFIYEKSTDFFAAAVEDITLIIKETLRDYPTFRIALPGGETPRELYKLLAMENLPWNKMTFIQLDERNVPSDSRHSNLKLLRDNLYNHAAFRPKDIYSFDMTLGMDAAIKNMQGNMEKLLQVRRPLFDLLLLGAGEDGHIGSIFEGDEVLKNALKLRPLALAAPAKAVNYEIEERMTLTLRAMLESKAALLLLKGPKKAPLAEIFMQKNIEALPKTLATLTEKIPMKVLFCADL